MSEQTNDFEEFYGAKFEDLAVGQSGVYARTVTEADILAFAGVTGDFNPVHVNEELAAASMFGGRIAHGMLSAGFISTVFGTKFPAGLHLPVPDPEVQGPGQDRRHRGGPLHHQGTRSREAQGQVRHRMHGEGQGRAGRRSGDHGAEALSVSTIV
jgi:hypothetical protein